MAKKTKVNKNAKSSKKKRSVLSQEELNQKIQEKAFELYQIRGFVCGNDWNDWFEAEKLVLAEQS